MFFQRVAVVFLLVLAGGVRAALPAPPASLFDFPPAYSAGAPGPFSYGDYLVKPVAPILVHDGHFFTPDNRRVRFLGVNFCFNADFPSHEQADLLAPRLASYGINIVRFHHMDNQPFPAGIFADRSLTALSPGALDRLDYFINALKRKGIYADLNLHVSRSYAKAARLPGGESAPDMDKLIDLFDPALMEAQKAYASNLLTHVNAYTHLAYTEEPAVAMIEITNEDTFFIWGGQHNLDTLPAPFAATLRGKWSGWLTAKYKSREAVAAAWTSLPAEEQLSDNSIRLGTSDLKAAPARAHDWYDFLQQTDEEYFTAMHDFIKNGLHAKAPVTGTIGLGALGTLSQTRTEFIDAHQYWEHPSFPHKQWDLADWTIKNSPMVDSATLGILPDLAAIRVAGKPFTVTEFQEPAPNEYRAEALPLIATFAALQDWDALFVFAYSHNSDYFKPHPESFFDIEGDPVHMNLMPVAARLFTSGQIAPLPPENPVYISREESLSNAKRFYFNLWPQLTTLHKIAPQALLQHQAAITFAEGFPLTKPGAETRPLSWTASKEAGFGRFSFSDPHGAVFVGFPTPEVDLHLGPLTLSHMHTAFLVATLTPQNPADTLTGSTLLLTLNGRTDNKDMQWNSERTSIGTHWGTTPQLETINATLSFPGYTLTPLDPAGKALPAVASPVDLSTVGSMWFVLTRSP